MGPLPALFPFSHNTSKLSTTYTDPYRARLSLILGCVCADECISPAAELLGTVK